MPNRLLIVILFCVNALAFASSLGEIDFPVSANEASQKNFIKGVLLLHNFEYDNARIKFQMAEKDDPDNVMAFWGEAMTYNQPLWGQQDFDSAKQVLNKIASTDSERIQKAKTAKEKEFMNAINILYGNDIKPVRDKYYSKAMCDFYKKNPQDDEIATFCALAILGTTEGNKDDRKSMQAGAIALDVISHNPKHPGALHYAIHAFDDPVHAPLGLPAALAYGKIASDSAHALHMPSHIFFALGMWDQVILANSNAWKAALNDNPDSNPEKFTIHDLHALMWLSYAYLQKQQYDSSLNLVKTMESIAIKADTTMAKWHYGIMRAAYITESRNLGVDLKSLNMDKIELSSRASDIYANALVALHHSQDVSAIHKSIDELNTLIKTLADELALNKVYKDYYSSVTSFSIDSGKIVALELQALLKMKEGNTKEAISLLKKAADIEDKSSVLYGPPIPVKPASELLAEALYKDAQYASAYYDYRKILSRYFNRTIDEQGLHQTLQKLKESGIPTPEPTEKIQSTVHEHCH